MKENQQDIAENRIKAVLADKKKRRVNGWQTR